MRTHKPPKDSFEYLTKKDTSARGLEALDVVNSDPLKLIEEYKTEKGKNYEPKIWFENILNMSSINMIRKRKPTNIVLDKSVLGYINESTFKDGETLYCPEFEKSCVWVNVKDFGYKVSGKFWTKYNPERDPKEHLIVGITFIKDFKFLKDALVPNFKEALGDNITDFLSFSVLEPPMSYFIVHFDNMDLWEGRTFTRTTPVLSFEELNERLEEDFEGFPLFECVFKTLIALNMIKEGKFNVKSKIFEDRNVKWSSRKSKKAKRKGLKFKQKYRQYKTSYYSIDPSQQKERSTYTTPEHYTPRNIPSHFKERWVTIDYVEKHNVPDEDIIDIEDRTKLYKNGVATKAWVKIKLWFEFTQDPNLTPKQEIERYRV